MNHLSAAILLLLHASVTATASLFPDEALPTSSGYLPVSPSSASSLFYAFYEAQHPHPGAPLLLWLQGGPGCSSMVGNLYELGPWLLTGGNLTDPFLERNPYPWNRIFGLLFIDNPIGSGFSFASSVEEIPRNQTALADHLYFALQAFFSSNPSFRLRPFYVTGESYAGKYVPAVAYYIQQTNPHVDPSLRINLRGAAIGNGLTHPVTQVATHAVATYYSGLINRKQQKELEEIQCEAVRLTNTAKWAAATYARDRVLTWLQNATGLATLYDLRRNAPYEQARVGHFLQQEEARTALGVTRPEPFEVCSATVGGVLHEDVMKSAKFMVERLLEEGDVRVLLYQGLFDLRDGVVSTEAWVTEMEWEGTRRFLEAPREVWRVEAEVAGYVQKWGMLANVVVGGAGHLVPTDQGRRAQAMVEAWVGEDDPLSSVG